MVIRKTSHDCVVFGGVIVLDYVMLTGDGSESIFGIIFLCMCVGVGICMFYFGFKLAPLFTFYQNNILTHKCFCTIKRIKLNFGALLCVMPNTHCHV